MINSTSLIIAGALLCASAQSSIIIADGETPVNVIIKAYTEKVGTTNRLYFGPDVFWVQDSPNNKHMHLRERGLYLGIKAGYDHTVPNGLYIGLDGLYGLGRAHFRVKDSDLIIHKSSAFGTFANAEARAGYNFSNKDKMITHLTPFLGVGGYFLRPSSHISQNWVYAAAGIRWDLISSACFNLGVRLKAMRSFYYQERAKVGRHHDTISSHHTSNIWGYGVEVPLMWRFGDTQRWNIQLDPYYLNLNIRDRENVFGGNVTFGYLF